jgi:HAD superfamily hydrolase (TIGR01509 family)
VTDFQRDTRAIIFDLDGTLADSEPLHREAFVRLFRELDLEGVEQADWHSFIGTSDGNALRLLLAGRDPGQSFDDLLHRKATHFLDLLRERQPLYPGVAELIDDLAPRYRLAVASGSLRTAIAGTLALRDLHRHFPITVSVQDVAHGKPAPDLFLRAAELLGLPPSDCVAIEDSIPGVTAARAAHLRVIAVTHTSTADRLLQAGAHAVVHSIDELRPLLLDFPHQQTLR